MKKSFKIVAFLIAAMLFFVSCATVKAPIDTTGAVKVSSFEQLQTEINGFVGEKVIILKGDIAMTDCLIVEKDANITIIDDGSQRSLIRANKSKGTMFNVKGTLNLYGSNVEPATAEKAKLVIDGTGVDMTKLEDTAQYLISVNGTVNLYGVCVKNVANRNSSVTGSIFRGATDGWLIDLENCFIIDNIGMGNATVIGMGKKGKVVANNSVFKNNVSGSYEAPYFPSNAIYGGSIIYNNKVSDAEFHNCTFENNYVENRTDERNAACFWWASDASLVLDGCSFINNVDANGAGYVVWCNKQASTTNVVVTNCTGIEGKFVSAATIDGVEHFSMI